MVFGYLTVVHFIRLDYLTVKAVYVVHAMITSNFGINFCFDQKLSELVLAILEIDNAGPEDYKHMIFPSTRSSFKCSILHLAAERSLVQIIKYAVEFYPKLGNKPLNVDGDNFYPVNFLLEMKDNVLSESTMKATDEAASFLLSKMQRDRYSFILFLAIVFKMLQGSPRRINSKYDLLPENISL